MAPAGHDDSSARPASDRRPVRLPAELEAALAAAPEAGGRFAELPTTLRREYARWVADARRTDVRERRAAQTVMRLLERP